jgi:hypothetical protein
MSTSEQHAVTRRDPLDDEPAVTDERHQADQQDRTDGFTEPDTREPRDPMLEDTQQDATHLPAQRLPDSDRDHSDRDYSDPERSDVDSSPVTDGGAAEPTRSGAGTVSETADRSGVTTDQHDPAAGGDRTPLVPGDRAESYATRWNEVKGMFVDEPRQAVQKADELVGELLEDLQRGFTEQRHDIEQGLDNDDTSTEDLRMALRRYRSFFDRLLSV